CARRPWPRAPPRPQDPGRRGPPPRPPPWRSSSPKPRAPIAASVAAAWDGTWFLLHGRAAQALVLSANRPRALEQRRRRLLPPAAACASLRADLTPFMGENAGDQREPG